MLCFWCSTTTCFGGALIPKAKGALGMARLPAHSVLAFVYLPRQERDGITALDGDLSFGDTGQIWKPFCKHTQALVMPASRTEVVTHARCFDEVCHQGLGQWA